MRVGKRIATVIMAVMMVLGTAGIAFAGTWTMGTESNQDKWRYDNGGGSYANSGWQWIDGNNDGVAECYYFDTNGWLLTGTMTPDGYQVNENGAWVEAGVVKTQAAQKDTSTGSTAQQTVIEANGVYYYSYTTLYFWNEQSQEFEVHGKTPVHSGRVAFGESVFRESVKECEAIGLAGNFTANMTILSSTENTLDIYHDTSDIIKHYIGGDGKWIYAGYKFEEDEEVSYTKDNTITEVNFSDSETLIYSYSYINDYVQGGIPKGTRIRVERVYKK